VRHRPAPDQRLLRLDQLADRDRLDPVHREGLQLPVEHRLVQRVEPEHRRQARPVDVAVEQPGRETLPREPHGQVRGDGALPYAALAGAHGDDLLDTRKRVRILLGIRGVRARARGLRARAARGRARARRGLRITRRRLPGLPDHLPAVINKLHQEPLDRCPDPRGLALHGAVHLARDLHQRRVVGGLGQVQLDRGVGVAGRDPLEGAGGDEVVAAGAVHGGEGALDEVLGE
jgi:hypothetical protein